MLDYLKHLAESGIIGLAMFPIGCVALAAFFWWLPRLNETETRRVDDGKEPSYAK